MNAAPPRDAPATSGQAAVRLADSGEEIIIEGPHYLGVFERLHERLRPRTYFEVGTWHGDSLRVARCTSLAVDADFRLDEEVIGQKPICIFHQTTSDEFFASQDPVAILGGRIDLAFIDALHVFEYALRDFIGTERSVHKKSIIVLDDCCPRDFYMTRRTLIPEVVQPTKYRGYWTGDVWKLVPVLREYRPDITLACIDTRPTGLVACMNLNPDDRTLEMKYDEIVAKWRDVTLPEYTMARLLDDLRFVSADAWVKGVAPLYDEPPESRERPGPRPQTQRERAKALAAELDRVHRSRSWRVTRPLRWLAARARGH